MSQKEYARIIMGNVTLHAYIVLLSGDGRFYLDVCVVYVREFNRARIIYIYGKRDWRFEFRDDLYLTRETGVRQCAFAYRAEPINRYYGYTSVFEQDGSYVGTERRKIVEKRRIITIYIYHETPCWPITIPLGHTINMYMRVRIIIIRGESNQ